MSAGWVTDHDRAAAGRHFAERIPGFVLPAAYGVARLDTDLLTFGHVNALGAVRPLPAVVLASVCGYVSSTATHRLDREQFEQAVALLSPAEAATHMAHPNLWSWRDLLSSGTPGSCYLAIFVAATEDAPVDEYDALFRHLLTA